MKSGKIHYIELKDEKRYSLLLMWKYRGRNTKKV